MKKILARLVLVIVLYLMFVGCGVKTINMVVTRPAEINLKNYRRIVVGDFVNSRRRRSRHAKDIADKITEVLFSSDYFTVLDRNNLRIILSEQRLGLSGLVDEEKSTKPGKIIGVAAIVSGRIQSDRYRKEITEKPRKDKDGKQYKIIWIDGEYHLSINIKIVNIETIEIIAIKTLTAICIDTVSARNKQPKPIKDVLYRRCVQSIADKFIKMIAPYQVTVSVVLQTDKLLPEVDEAIGWFNSGEWKRGMELLTQATKHSELSPEIKAKSFYNLGLVQMYRGEYGQSFANLKIALKLMPGKKIYQRALREVKEEEKKAMRLKRQIE